MPTEFQHLIVERRGPVGWIINNRPERLNALNSAMREEFAPAWQQLDNDPEVRVIVHTGNGRAFQTGMDVADLTDDIGIKRYEQSTKDFDLRLSAWHMQIRKPVILAVNGVCAAGGLHWVVGSDIVIAASNATFVDPHVSVGLVSAFECIGLMRRMPVESVMRMALVGSGERLSAQRAYELGMVSQVVDPPETLRDVAQELGEQIARNSPTAMAATKRALWRSVETGLTDACRAGAADLVSMWGHPDQDEGPRAFAQKRPPDWQPLTAVSTGSDEETS